MRDSADFAGLVSRLLDLKQLGEQRGVRIDIHLTHGAGEKTATDGFAHDRPDLPTTIRSAFDNMSGSLFIAGTCKLRHDCADAGSMRTARLHARCPQR